MKTCVIIPTYNEAKSIAGLIAAIRQNAADAAIVVIDDGSTDDTYRLAQKSRATVLRNETNEGKGACLAKGFNYAVLNGFDAVITMDGDGQHLPEDVAYFINLAKYSDSAMLIGNRMCNPKNMPYLRILTNKFMSWLISKAAKQKIYDTQCGFRLIKREIFEKIKLTTRKYETESEILIKAARLGFKIQSVPIKSVYLDEKSRINPFLDTLRFIRFITGEFIRKSDG